jgi:ribosomal protein S18 acetylase RimI-like enzyme
MSAVHLTKVDLGNAEHARRLVELLDHYALDPMGGGRALADSARQRLVAELRRVPGYHAALAWDGGAAVGLVNCFVGFSTFAARPLLNIHDIVVRRDRRGRGIGRALLAWAEDSARSLGCCKLTLEVLSNNHAALGAYRAAGFLPYQLDPAAGTAVLLQKLLA